MTNDYVWGGYPRISDDPHDERTGVDRQMTDIKQGVAQRGGDPDRIKWYPENNTSAYRKRRVKKVDDAGNEYYVWRVIRPQWQQALADLRSGVIDGLIVYDLDRLARDLRDLEDAIEVVTYYGRRIEGFTPGTVRLDTSDGITMARVMVVMAAKSSADTGRRVKRAHEEFAIEGKPVGGTRPFGWEDDKATIIESERTLVLAAAEQLIDGVPMTEIARRWNDAGVLTTRGKAWRSTSIKQYFTNPRLAGWRTAKGEIALDREGEPVRGLWEPMMDQDMFDLLQVRLVQPDTRARKSRRGARYYLLTGTIRCGVCLRPMYGSSQGGKGSKPWAYVCNTQTASSDGHRNSANGKTVDAIVETQVLLHMASTTLEPVKVEFAGAARLAEVENLIAESLAELRAGGVSSKTVFAFVRSLETERDELEAQRRAWLAESLIPVPSQVSVAQWDKLSTDEKRPYIESALDSVLLMPAMQRGSRWVEFDETRLHYDWRVETTSVAARR